MKAKFIVVDGPHGSGKTTIARLIVRQLRRKGAKAIYTKEPFSKELSSIITRLSTDAHSNPKALALLLAADRQIHLKEIDRQVEHGVTVVSDRYFPSSLVYQSIDGLDLDFIRTINKFAREPDFFVLLVPPTSVLMDRIHSKMRNRKGHRFLRSDFVRREQEMYRELAKRIHPSITITDTEPASKHVDSILSSITS